MDAVKHGLRFFRESGGALVPANGPALGAFAQVAQAPGGRAAELVAARKPADAAARPTEIRPVAMPAPAPSAGPRASERTIDRTPRRGSL